MKLEKFAKDTKDYIEELAGINEKLGKETKTKLNNIRKLLKHKNSRILDSFFNNFY